MATVSMNLHVSDYTSAVLGVIKEKFSLKDKSSALEKFAELFGEDFVDKEIKDDVVLEIIRETEKHKRNYPNRTMTLAELRKLCGVSSR